MITITIKNNVNDDNSNVITLPIIIITTKYKDNDDDKALTINERTNITHL